MIDIEIIEDFKVLIDRFSVSNAAEAALAYLAVPPTSSLSILITTDQQIQALNKKYRDVDQATDVLAFPAGHSNPEDGSIYLGDVIISYQRAVSQADVQGHKTIEEIQLLVIHGILHLLHFDHADPDGKKRMWIAKDHILEKLEIGSWILEDR